MSLDNWCGTSVVATEGQWRVVTSVSELSRAIRSERRHLRMMGARYTFPDQVECDRGTVAVVMDLPGRGRPTLVGDVVRVTGDTLLAELWEFLALRDLEPSACPPVITHQTVAGALATGTHAQGLVGGTLSDAVTALEIIDATGTMHRVSPADAEFDSVILALGCMGAVVSVEFSVRPTDSHVCRKITVPEDEMLASYHRWNEQSGAVKAWWFTESGLAHVWLVGGDGEATADLRWDNRLDGVVMATRDRLIDDIGDDSGQAPATRTLARFLRAEDTAGTWHEIFKNGIPAPQLNMEIAVPTARFAEAGERIRHLLARRRPGVTLHYPVILRTTGRGRGLVSPSGSGSVCYFGFVSYMDRNSDLPVEMGRLFDDLQECLYELGGRPHWGKYFDPRLVAASRARPREDFARAVADFDPTGKFKNRSYYRAVGLED